MALFFTIAVLIFLLGFIVPTIKYNDYALKLCSVVNNSITGSYVGNVVVKYIGPISSLTRWFDVVENDSSVYVQKYLDANYKIGIQVPCFVSSDDIKLFFFTNIVVVVIGSISSVFFIISFIIFIVISVKLRRRLKYKNLDEIEVSKPKRRSDLDIV